MESSPFGPNSADTVQARISPAHLPPTSKQTRSAQIAAAVLLVGLVVLLPFAANLLPGVSGFIPAIDAIIFGADLITAGFLFAQFSISRARSLLALGCGYFFSAAFVAAHALTFPGAFSATGNIGGRLHTNFRMYLLWHLALPVAIFAYSWFRNDGRKRSGEKSPKEVSIIFGAAGLLALVSCIAYLALLPDLAPLEGRWLTAATMLICGAALATLWIHRLSALDQWLMVVVLAMIVELAITALVGGRGPSRFTLGFYTGRLFSLVTSTVVLAALLSETTTLYTGVARTNLLSLIVDASHTLSGEIELPKLAERLVKLAFEHSPADHGLLILPSGNEFFVQAEGRSIGDRFDITLLQEGVSGLSCPESIVRHVIRTRKAVVLGEASEPTGANPFSRDPYLRIRRPRSILCLPLIHQGILGGLLYLESAQTPWAFTPERVRLLELLASQAAISLQNAALYTELQIRVGLLELLPVSAWTLKPDGTPDFVNQVWLDFAGQTLDFIRSHPEAWMTAIHPEDRERATRIFREGVRTGQGFAFETRSLRVGDGTYRWHLQQAVVLRDANGSVVKFVGTTTDIDDQKRAEVTLLQTQSDLAHLARVATLNAMTASIAHEVNQPLAGVLINANTCVRMLGADPPNLAGAAETARRTVRDVNRASEVIQRLRAMFSKKAPALELMDLNEATREVIALSAVELQRSRATLQTDLGADLPLVRADRVQLQQVILNLLLNAVDAMATVEDGPRRVLITTTVHENGSVKLAVQDCGTGVTAESAEKLFQPFYTTKANGLGIGLSICSSIIKSHDGCLWTQANEGRGATFSFCIPGAIPDSGMQLDSASADVGREPRASPYQ